MMSVHRAAKEGATAHVSEDFNQITGGNPRSFEKFCEEMRHEWQLHEDQGPSLTL